MLSSVPAANGSCRQPRRGAAWLGIWVAGLAGAWISQRAWVAAFAGFNNHRTLQGVWAIPQQPRRQQDSTVAMLSSIVKEVDNPVRTVSDTLADFYKAYPQPPVLPMYRPFLVDLMTQTHLAIVDSRFKYDAIFALGLCEFFTGLMSAYDKTVGSEQTDKIWDAMLEALGMDPAEVKADAEAVVAYGKATSPAEILKHMEGVSPDAKVGEAFKSISSSLYSMPFSVGLFKLMEYSGVEVTKANTEEWADALKLTKTKVNSDLETYKLNVNKLQKAEEMLREIEIREKKKLAQRLEEKAKALAAKAAGKTEEKKEE